MKSFNKKRLAACLGLAMGMSVAASGVQAVEVAADNVGKVLMGPVFTARANTSTKITISNPDNDRAVKARIGFRSEAYSDEFFDFVIYLSPGDVFRGEIYGTADGTVMFKSSDDSVRHLPGSSLVVVFSDTHPTDFAVPTTGVREGDTAAAGHFEVVSVYSAEGTVATPEGDVEIVRGMSKVELAKVFDVQITELSELNGCATGADITCDVLKANVETTAEIYGEAEVSITGENRVYYPLTALTYSDENGNGIADCEPAAFGGYCEKVQGNPGFDVIVGNELLIGTTMLPNNGDNIVNLERALAVASSQGLYNTVDNTMTQIMVTFPTRYRHEANDVCASVGEQTPTNGFSGPFREDRSVPYFVSQFDNNENLVPGCSPVITEESNLISGDQDTRTEILCPPAFIFNEVEVIPYDWTTTMNGLLPVGPEFVSGKYHLELSATTPEQGNTCASIYRGVPAIVKTLKQSSTTGQIIGVTVNH